MVKIKKPLILLGISLLLAGCGGKIVTKNVTFVADNVTVDVVSYQKDDLSIEEPDVPVKEHYTGEWEDYDLSSFEDLTVQALYTPIDYVATFYIDNQLVETITYNVTNYQEKVAPTIPERAGFLEGKWVPEVNFGALTNQRYDAEYKDIIVKGQGSFSLNESGVWTSENDNSIATFNESSFTKGTISTTLHKSDGNEDSGIVFNLSSESDTFFEGEGISYYFFFVNVNGAAYLAKCDGKTWTELAINPINDLNEEDDYPLAVSVSEDHYIRCFVNDKCVIKLLQDDLLPGTRYGMRAGKSGTTFASFTVSEQVKLENNEGNTDSYFCSNGSFVENEDLITTTDSKTLLVSKGLRMEENVRYETVLTQNIAQDAALVFGLNDDPHFTCYGWELSRTYYCFLLNRSGAVIISTITNGQWETVLDNNNIKTFNPTVGYKLGVEYNNGKIRCFIDNVFFGEINDTLGAVGKPFGLRAETKGATFSKITSRTVTLTNEWYQRSGESYYDETNDVLYGEADGTLLWCNNKTFGPGQTLEVTQYSSVYSENGIVFGCDDKVGTRWIEKPYYFLDLTHWTCGLGLDGKGWHWVAESCQGATYEGIRAPNPADGNTLKIVWTLVGEDNHFTIYLNDNMIYDLTDSTHNLKGTYFGFRSVTVGVSWSNISITDNI